MVTTQTSLVTTLLGYMLFVAVSTLLPQLASAEVYPTPASKTILCSRKRVTVQDAAGNITIRHRNPRELILGQRVWNFQKLSSAIGQLESRPLTNQLRRRLRKMQAAMAVLMSCYDQRSLPRPGTTPSNPGDDGGLTPNPSASPTPSPSVQPPTFEGVREILQANCMTCHAARGWTLTEQYLRQANLVIPGQPVLSPLYRYLRGNPEGLTPRSMPPAGPALTAAQIAVISTWITSLGQNGGGTPPGSSPTPSPSPTVTPTPGHFGCIANTHIAPSKMKRLSKRQLYNTMRTITTVGSIDAGTADAIIGTYEWHEFRGLNEDYSKLGHARLDDRLDEYFLEAWLVFLEAWVTRLESWQRLDDLVQAHVPACTASNYLSESCRNQFLTAFGRRVFKASLSQVDYNFYRRPNSNGQSQATYRELLIRLLSAPKFLYLIEVDGAPIDNSGLVLRTTPREFITRLAYTLWNTIPDAQLIQFAEDGTVDNNPAAVVAYALDQQAARTRLGLEDFFDGWLKIHHYLEDLARYFQVNGGNRQLLSVNYGAAEPTLFADLSNESAVNSGMSAYKVAAGEEIPELGAILAVDTNGRVSDLFRTRLAPVTNNALVRNYGMSGPWNGSYNSIPLAAPSRAGILTRSGFLINMEGRTRPIMRGVRIREDILCDTTGLPTNNANPPGTVTNSFSYVTGTTQNRVRHITEQAGTQCASCHLRYINPLGFLLERFDSNGRRRANGMEVVFEQAPGTNSVQQFSNPFDTVMAPYVARDDASVVNGVEGLSERIATSTEMHACYTRNIVRFTLNRVERDGFDACMMNDILSDARNLPMKEVLRRMFLHPSFRLRRRDEVFTAQ